MDVGDERGRAHTANFNGHLFDQMRSMHRAWIEKLQEIRALEVDYGTRLMAAKDPSEAALFCSEWMSKRLEIIAREQTTFVGLWARLLLDVTGRHSAALSKHDQ